MSKSILFALALGLAVSASAAESKAASQTVKGEIVDMACYMGHAGKGEKHAECAKSCVANGAPMGLLKADGNVVLLVNDHKKEQAYADAKTLAGESVAITGNVVNRGGLTALVVEKAEKGK